MKTIEYRTVDKSAWGEGPWASEPDKRQWQDQATGYPCLIVRNPRMGFLCGYVGLPKGHPAHGLDYNAIEVNVHGGLTFADGCAHGDDESVGVCHKPGDGEPDDTWWAGFDCGHGGDLAPGIEPMMREARKIIPPLIDIPEEYRLRDVYRDFAYVTAQVEALAQQLAAIATTSPNVPGEPAQESG